MGARTTVSASTDVNVHVDRDVLVDALSNVGLVAARGRTSIPIASAVHLLGTDAGLRLTATDFDRTVTLTLPADGAENFPARTAPCHRLAGIVAALAPGSVRITPSANGVRLDAGRAWFDVAGQPADEFPMGTTQTSGTSVAQTVDAPAFLSALSRALTHASQAPSRPTLNGVHVDAAANAPLRIVATDGYRVVREYVERSAGPAIDMIIPRPSVVAMAKLFDASSHLVVELSGLHAVVTDADDGAPLQFDTRLIEGPYPDADPIFGRQMTTEATVDRLLLLGAVRRVSSLSSADRLLVRLTWNADHVLCAGVGDEDSGAAQDVVPCEYTGAEPLRIMFAPRYLTDALALRTADRLHIGLINGNSQMTIRDEDVSDAQNVVMPRRDPADFPSNPSR